MGVTVSEKIGMKDIRTDGYIDYNKVLLNTKPSNGVDIGPKKGLSAGGRQFWLACRYCWSPNSIRGDTFLVYKQQKLRQPAREY